MSRLIDCLDGITIGAAGVDLDAVARCQDTEGNDLSTLP